MGNLKRYRKLVGAILGLISALAGVVFGPDLNLTPEVAAGLGGLVGPVLVTMLKND